MKKVLVVDIGGTNVKAMISREGRRKFSSGPGLTPRQLHASLRATRRLEVRCRFDRLSRASQEWPHSHRSEKSRQRLDAIQFRKSLWQTGACH